MRVRIMMIHKHMSMYVHINVCTCDVCMYYTVLVVSSQPHAGVYKYVCHFHLAPGCVPGATPRHQPYTNLATPVYMALHFGSPNKAWHGTV